MGPYEDKSPFITSGIRLGTAAITTRGLVEKDMETIADLINEVVTNIKDEAVIAKVRSQVNELMIDQPLFEY